MARPKKNYPKSEILNQATYATPELSKNADVALLQQGINSSVDSFQGVNRYESIVGGRSNDFSNLAPGISGRPGMTREAYDAFRPDEATPKNYKEILEKCDIAYNSSGIIRNILDLMADFTSQGIRVIHKNKKIEAFGKNWAKQVQMDERSERFVNILLRLGTTVVRKMTAKVNVRVVEEMYKAAAEADIDIPRNRIKFQKKEIPWKYVFLHPGNVRPVGGEVAFFATTDPTYELVIPDKIKKVILNPQPNEKALVASLPDEIKAAAKNNRGVPLDPDKTRVFYYKKDDWCKFAFPICTPILGDIQLLDKLRLADSAALDGAISNVRIFKMGSLEHKIPPNPALVDRLASILQSNTAVGTLDLIWGPDIEMIESKSNVYEFLKKEKYDPTLNAIFMGLGVPPTLTGTAGSGTTNNYISLSTLIERLQYCRTILTDFWAAELNAVQKAMGFKDPFQIEFDIMNFGNDDTIKALYIQLSDRGLISDEKIQEIFELNPDVEAVRINTDESKRKVGAKPPKAGPFNQDEEKKGVPGQGRPKTKKDTTKRKTKKFTPRSKAMMNIWALDAQDKISEILNPIILSKYKRKNMRSLTSKETDEADVFKFSVLSNLKPLETVTQESIFEAMEIPMNMAVYKESHALIADFTKEYNKSPNYDELKTIRAFAYITINGENDG